MITTPIREIRQWSEWMTLAQDKLVKNASHAGLLAETRPSALDLTCLRCGRQWFIAKDSTPAAVVGEVLCDQGCNRPRDRRSWIRLAELFGVSGPEHPDAARRALR